MMKLQSNSSKLKKKCVLLPRQYTIHKSLIAMAKLHKLKFKLLPHPPYSLDLAPSNYYLFADLKKKCSTESNFHQMLIAATKAYFKSKDKLFYKKGVKMLKKHWNKC